MSLILEKVSTVTEINIVDLWQNGIFSYHFRELMQLFHDQCYSTLITTALPTDERQAFHTFFCANFVDAP